MACALLVACTASVGHSRNGRCYSTAPAKASPCRIVQKITSFKPGNRKSEARHFNFENYDFVTLDAAVQRLFPSRTKLSYVDKVLKGQGKAIKSIQRGAARYDYHFKFDRFDCISTVSVRFDSKTKRVISAHGNGRCD